MYSVCRLALFCSAILVATLTLSPWAHAQEKCRLEINNYLQSNFGYSTRDMAAVTVRETAGALGSSPQAASYERELAVTRAITHHQASTKACRLLVIRGGSWDLTPRNLRSAYRNWFGPTKRISYLVYYFPIY